jgi:outer membrane immunogenic protein
MKNTFTLAAAAALLIAGTAVSSAADLPVKAVAPAPIIWSWTGFYIGGHVGAGWGTTESTLTGVTIVPALGPPAPAFSLPISQNSRSGFLGGAQAGYNWQSGWAVFGVQADIAGADIKGTVPCLVVLSCTGTSNWLATASGRVGAVVLDRGLVYVKGGAAWLNTKHAANLPNLAGLLPPGTPSELTSKESNTWGWMLGMGTEWMITRNWTAFIEYDYIEFEKKNEAFPLNPALLAGLGAPPGASVTFNTDLKNRLSIAKVGVNYKFDWGTARY